METFRTKEQSRGGEPVARGDGQRWSVVALLAVARASEGRAAARHAQIRAGVQERPRCLRQWATLAALVVVQLRRGPPAECLQVDMRTRSSS